MMPDGQPQSSIVWCDYDGACVRVHTTSERQKGKNMQANPKVASSSKYGWSISQKNRHLASVGIRNGWWGRRVRELVCWLSVEKNKRDVWIGELGMAGRGLEMRR
jgi:hypothetical protein